MIGIRDTLAINFLCISDAPSCCIPSKVRELLRRVGACPIGGAGLKYSHSYAVLAHTAQTYLIFTSGFSIARLTSACTWCRWCALPPCPLASLAATAEEAISELFQADTLEEAQIVAVRAATMTQTMCQNPTNTSWQSVSRQSARGFLARLLLQIQVPTLLF